MLVKEMLSKIQANDLRVSDIADKYGVTTRTIQNKIKAIGYKWDAKTSIYNYVGSDPEPLDLEINELFTRKGSPNDDKTLSDSFTLDEKVNESSSKGDSLDMIDILLMSKKGNNGRVYRGFYFDEAVLKVIDSVDTGNKSHLINEALKKVFKEKGLM